MSERLGNRYTKELKEEILKRMMLPNNESVKRISEDTGITETTLTTGERNLVLQAMLHQVVGKVPNDGAVKISF